MFRFCMEIGEVRLLLGYHAHDVTVEDRHRTSRLPPKPLSRLEYFLFYNVHTARSRASMQRCTVEQELAKSNIQSGTLSLRENNSSSCTH